MIRPLGEVITVCSMNEFPSISAVCWGCLINTLRPRQNGRDFADDIFKRIFLNENVLISLKISLKFVPKGLINNIPALVQIMACRRPGDKPLSEPMLVKLPTRICVTRPQWVKTCSHRFPYHLSLHFLTWPLIGWRMCCQSIRGHICELLLAKSNSNRMVFMTPIPE